MVVTFCGHSDVSLSDDVREWLTGSVEKLIQEGATDFYLGGYGGFDNMAASVVWRLKEKYPSICSVLVILYLDREMDASRYDLTTYPPLENVPRRFAISRRNQWMVQAADVVWLTSCTVGAVPLRRWSMPEGKKAYHSIQRHPYRGF